MADSPPVTGVASTDIQGLDHILNGGIPRNRIYLVEGDPGAGKTTLALQFLMAGRAKGERVLYITLSETADELHGVVDSHNWSLKGIDLYELTALEQQLRSESVNTLFHPSEVELNETTAALLGEIDRVKPSRVVFDSLSELRLLAQSPLRYRRQLLALKQFFVGRNCTVLFLDDSADKSGDNQVQTLAHGVISLRHMAPEYGAEQRKIRISKMRGVNFRGGQHDFVIETGGIRVFPRLVAAESRGTVPQSSVPSGVAQIDQMLGGGLDRGTSTLVLGAAGTGKSVLSTLYAISAAKRGERAACFLFDESVHTFKSRTKSLGMDVEPLINNGTLTLQPVDPAELSPGQFAQIIRDSVEKQDARVVVIDSLNGYLQAMINDRFLTAQFHELLSYLGNHGVCTIMVIAQAGLIGTAMTSPVDISYLADNVILLRYFESSGEICKAISVVKKRSGRHETSIREYNLDSNGVKVGPALTRFRGILTGVPTLLPSLEQLEQ